jgi:hypothetical protein
MRSLDDVSLIRPVSKASAARASRLLHVWTLPPVRVSFALFVGLVAIIVVSSREIIGGEMLAFGDLPAYPSRPGPFVEAVRSAWSPRGFGSFGSATLSHLFSASLVGLLGNPALAQQVNILGWLPVGFLGMVFVCRRQLGTSWVVAAGAGLVFVSTPIAIGLMVAGSGGLIWSYALIPLLYLCGDIAERASRWGWIPYAVVTALGCAFLPEFLVLAAGVAITWSIFAINRRRTISLLLLAFLFASVAAAPDLYARFGGQADRVGALAPKAAADLRFTYDLISPLTLGRMAGNQGDPMHALGYNSINAWTVWGYLPCVGLLLAALHRPQARAAKRLWVILGSSAGALCLLSVISDHMEHLPTDFAPLLLFRNPQKLTILLAAALVPLAAFGAQQFLRVSSTRRLLAVWLTIVSVSAYLFFYTWPFGHGDWGLSDVRQNVTTPSSTLESSRQFLSERDSALDQWRTLWIPLSHQDSLTLEWSLPRWANEPVLERSSTTDQQSRLMVLALARGNLGLFHTIADRSSVKYVVVEREGQSADGLSTDLLEGVLAGDPSLLNVRTLRDASIWENSQALPRIRPISDLVAVWAGSSSRSTVSYRAPDNLIAEQTRSRSLSVWPVIHPRSEFSMEPDEADPVIRNSTWSTTIWPVLASPRVRIEPRVGYELTGQLKTAAADSAHLKIVWYRYRNDPEALAVRQDIAHPVISGTTSWTQISSGVRISPPEARYAEVQFLGGRRRSNARLAQTWVSDLSLVHAYTGSSARPSVKRSFEAASVAPGLVQGATLFDLRTYPRVLSGSAISAEIDRRILHINPTTVDLRSVQRRYPGVSTAGVIQAPVSLSPESGVWRRSSTPLGESVTLVSRTGAASLSLPRDPKQDTDLVLAGCKLNRLSSPRLIGSKTGCGLSNLQGPSSETTLILRAARGVSLTAVVLRPRSLDVEPADAEFVLPFRERLPSEYALGKSPAGILLADTYHSGWDVSGSGPGRQFVADLGFNGFLLDQPNDGHGLVFRPQATRDALLMFSFVAWVGLLLSVGFLLLRRVDFARRSRSTGGSQSLEASGSTFPPGNQSRKGMSSGQVG